MLNIITKRHFEKDVKLLQKRGKNLSKLKNIISLLEDEQVLPAKNKVHKLKGEYTGCWECHVEPDWLLVYILSECDLTLVRTGTRSDLF